MRLRGACCLSLVFSLSSPLLADNRGVLIEEVCVGLNGDSRVQFLELLVSGADQAAWGPQGMESESRAELVFLDAAGALSGVFPFPADAPIGLADERGLFSVLIATAAFAGHPDAPTPDFTLPDGLLVPGGGQLVFRNSAGNTSFPVQLHLSWGDFAGDTGDDGLDPATAAGPPAPTLSTTGTAGLRRFRNYDGAFRGARQQNADYRVEAATPRNSAGAVGNFETLPLEAQGETLFFEETFRGNGRSCGTCHFEEEGFAMSAFTVHVLRQDSQHPLFIAEQVSELSALENPCAIDSANALILENIDGFDQHPSFRGSPALFNLVDTAPYGLSGEFADLESFTRNAVLQHFPRTLGRNSDPSLGALDVRQPTADEVAAMEAFQLSLHIDFSLDQMMAGGVHRGADAELVRQGHDTFFGDRARCFLCHSGPSLSDVHPSLVESGVVPGPGNHAFATGVALDFEEFANVFGQEPEDKPAFQCFEEAQPMSFELERRFSTRPLVGAALRKSFFHDNSRHGLEEALRFYCTGCDENFFAISPAFDEIGGLSFGGVQDIESVKAFLETLVPPPEDCLVGPDCNENGLADDCELAMFWERDCDNDGTIDACTASIVDCNENGVADACDLHMGTAVDCDRNGIPDTCDLRDFARDCDRDGVLDDCERHNVVLLDEEDPEQGLVIDIVADIGFTSSGPKVETAGDVDGDGIEDLLLGVPAAEVAGVSNSGLAWIVFGSPSLHDLARLDPAALPPSARVRILPGPETRGLGNALAALGDIDGDGWDDVAIAASGSFVRGLSRTGRVYVLFGGPALRKTGDLSLDALPLSAGLVFDGLAGRDLLGDAIASVGDADGDGLRDFVLGAPFADPLGRSNAGEAYVLFGDTQRENLAAITLDALDGQNGLRVHGVAQNDNLGGSVAGLGDFDGDGISDLALGAAGAGFAGQASSGGVWVLFGDSDEARPARVDLGGEDADGLLVLEGHANFGTGLGMGLAGLGDVNGDGLDDLFFGAPTAGGGGGGTGGLAHVVFGSAAHGLGGVLALPGLSTAEGFTLHGDIVSQRFGLAAAGRSDVNGDGLGDFVVADQGTGALYLVYGRTSGWPTDVFTLAPDVAPLPGGGLLLTSSGTDSFSSTSLSVLQDIDGDGLDELAVGQFGGNGRVRVLRMPFVSLDCDVDGILDSCEIAADASLDSDADGRLDSCEGRVVPEPEFLRGDSNQDGRIDISDAFKPLAVLFLGAEPLQCEKAADVNDDGRVDVSDSTHLLDYLFREGPRPPLPHALCGEDGTPDDLHCREAPGCA